ncbi:MAG: glycoside hydrolase family 95 protein, partial [Candidatus Aminicenantes bacterium]|nr:glycoside hydrolase family 95 protein [Candidatus Aminicenantes bacterium]
NIGNEVADTVPTDVRLQNLRSGRTDSHLAVLFFQYGRYLLISGSTRPGVLPLNLQGIWNEDIWAAWESDYHLNINLQMNYWPADVCNLPETLEPLSNFICLLSEKGKTTAKNFIGSDGWVAHHCTNSFGRTTPSGSTKHSQVFNGYSFPMAGAWMSLSLWRHYEFTEDKEYLKNQVYPVLKGAAEFILDFLKENENGELVTAPSYSPENMYIDPATGKRMLSCVAASIDIQIIKDIFNACLASEKILSKKHLTHKIQAAMAKLPDVKIGADGTIQEWYEDFEEVEPGHRHISHLFALYPSNQITKDTSKLFEAAEKTIEKRLSTGGGQTGWSRAWIINFYARLYNGDESLKHLDMLLQNQVSPNLFDMHPAPATRVHGLFQIDGNLGATSGVAEMLLQSHSGEIHLLPALPGTWSVGKVKGLRARGGFEVSMEWNNGELISAKVKSINGNNCILKYKKTQVEISFEKEEEVVFNNQLDIIGETKLRTID